MKKINLLIYLFFTVSFVYLFSWYFLILALFFNVGASVRFKYNSIISITGIGMIYTSALAFFLLIINNIFLFSLDVIFLILVTICLLLSIFNKEKLRKKVDFNLWIYLGPIVWTLLGIYTKITKGDSWIAWSLSGDSRNGIAWILKIIEDNSISIVALSQYAQFPFGINAIFGNLLTNSDETLIWRTIEVNSFFLFTIIGVTCGLFGEISFRILRDTPGYLNNIVIGAASLLPLSSLFLGINLFNGFVNSIWVGMPLLFGVLLIISREAFNFKHYLFCWLLYVFSLMTWTLLAPLFILISQYMISNSIRFSNKKTAYLSAFIIYSITTIVFLTPNILAKSKLGDVAAEAGGTFPEPVNFFIFVSLVLTLSKLISDGKRNRKIQILFISVLIYISLTVFFISSNWNLDSSFWSYYSLKFLWLNLFWLLAIFIPIFFLSLNKLKSKMKVDSVTQALILIFVTLLVLNTSPVNHQLRSIAQGWYYPNSTTVNLFREDLAFGPPIVYWQYFEQYNENRLANFWVALRTLNTNEYDTIKTFAYDSDHQSLYQLCGLVNSINGLEIKTKISDLKEQIEKECVENFNSNRFRISEKIS